MRAHHSSAPVSYMQCCQWMFCILKYVVMALMGANTLWFDERCYQYTQSM